MPATRGPREYVYSSMTRSLCGTCKEPVDGRIVFEAGRVRLRKFCPTHGHAQADLASSVEWYLDALSFQSPAEPPRHQATTVARGCPLDCGACPSHRQTVRLPVIPITSGCNLACPICYTINRNDPTYVMPREEMRTILARLRDEGAPDIVNFTGGEPTLHPELPELLEMCREAGIRRLTVSTNGLRLRDEAYVRRLAAADARIVLSLDTFRPEVSRTLVGQDTVEAKRAALDLLERHDVPTTILPVIVAGLNDAEVGPLLDLVLARPHVRSMEVHTMTFTGQGGAGFPRAGRITIPDIHRLIREHTAGRIGPEDFVPSPLAHPLCYSICYLLCLDGGGYVPFTRLMGRERLYGLLQGGIYIEPDERAEGAFREVLDRLWADPASLPEADRVLRTIRGMLDRVYPPGRPLPLRERIAVGERYVKAIYIHSHMDEETFDVSRVMRCPVAVPAPDGSAIPTCAYNVIYRARDPRFARGLA